MKRSVTLVAALAAVAVAASLAPVAQAAPPVSSCSVFPANNYWHADVSALPVLPRSDVYVRSIGRSVGLKADFGSGLWNGGPIGIPYMVEDAATRIARLRPA